MAMRKIGRGKGALRCVSSPPVPGSIASAAAVRPTSPRAAIRCDQLNQDELLEIRVTGIVDLTSFWVQMGTASQLEEFDLNSLQLSSWCSERGGGRMSLPLVKDVIAVRDKKSGLQPSTENATSSSWSRAEVIKQLSDSQVEVLYVDTGSSARVSLSEICREMPPKEMLLRLHRQAVHCFLHGVQTIEGQKSFPERVTERFRELVQLPCGSVKGIKNFVIGAKNAALTLYIQYEGSWFSVAEILKREGLVQYDPACAISISDPGATPSEGNRSSDATPTPTNTRSFPIVSDDGSTPVPLNSSPLHFLPETPPLPTTSPTPQSPRTDEDQSDTPPSLNDGSSVDTDSSTLGGGKTDREELGEQQSTITAAASGSGFPLLTISLPKLTMSSVAAVTRSQLKLPMTLSSIRKQTSNVDSSSPATGSTQETATPHEGEVYSKLLTSPLSMEPLSEPLVGNDSKVNDKLADATSQPSTAGAVEEQLPQLQTRQKPLVESSTCTEEEEDNEDDVIEVESEVDIITVGGGEGEGEGEGEKETSVSADTLSSDDEWDESLLPPRSGSSDSSPSKNDVAEAAEYFRKVDMRANRKLWAQNNSQKHGAHRKNTRPFHDYNSSNNSMGYNYQDHNKKSSPTHSYHESLRRWGSYSSPSVEGQDVTNYQGHPPTWYPGVGRGRRARGSGGGGAGGQNRSMGRGRRGGQYRNVNTGMGQGWPEEYPRPHPPPAYVDGIQQSQLVRRPGMAGAGRGGVRGVANDFDGYQSASSGPLQQTYPSSYSGGIQQSQLVRQPSVNKQSFQRSSSSPSDLSTSPQQGDGHLQRDDGFSGGFVGGAGGCGHGQTPPSQPSAGGGLGGVGSGVYRGLTEEQIKNEVGWHTSVIERAVKKIMSSLTSSNLDQFASKILELLGDSKAQKLLSLSSPRTPLEVIMLSVVKGALEGEWSDDGCDVILTAMEKLIDAAPHQACTFLQSSLTEVAREVSSSGGRSKMSQRFCSFLGRLFISASYFNKEDYSTAVGQAVKECLDMWCSVDAEIPDFQKVAYAQCFSFLCGEIGPTIDDSSKDNLDAYFDKHVRENILNEKLSRQVREIFLNLLIRRLNSWDGRKKVEPPSTTTTTTAEAPPREEEATPTPTSLTPVPPPPPAVTDYPVGAQNSTDPSSSVVHPIPVSAISVAHPHPASGNVYQSSVSTGPGPGGHELAMEYGSVRAMLSPQPQNSSVFMPTTAFAPQHHHSHHSQVHRALSLPGSLQQQQRAPTPSPSVRSSSLSDVPADDPYAQITDMLHSLSLVDLLPRFEEYMIKDYVLDCENENIKSCLQEASIPLGAVVGILDYIEKRRKSKKTVSGQQRSSTSGGHHHQLVPHPTIYSPSELISRSSAPTPAPSMTAPVYMTQQFQQPEPPFPVLGSAESATPTLAAHYSHYPQQSGGQMNSPQFEQLPAPQYPTSPLSHDQNLQQQKQQQFQYTQSHQSQQQQVSSTNALPRHQHQKHQQVAHPPSLQLQYQPSSPSTPSSQGQLAQPHSQHQQQLPPLSRPQRQQQVQGQEVHPRSPLVSLPHSSGGAGGGSHGNGGGSMATSPTTAQRRVTLPTAAVSQRGPPSLSQLQSARQSHSQTRQDGNTAATLRGDGQPSSSTSSSHGYQQPEPQSPAAASAPPLKPVGGFGTIMCVCCGASDHKTPNCPQRKNFFF